jgi:hypothetical protein
VYDLPEFWVVFGIMIYFSGNFFIFIFAQNNLNENSFKKTFNTINALSSIIENIMFLIGALSRLAWMWDSMLKGFFL